MWERDRGEGMKPFYPKDKQSSQSATWSEQSIRNPFEEIIEPIFRRIPKRMEKYREMCVRTNGSQALLRNYRRDFKTPTSHLMSLHILGCATMPRRYSRVLIHLRNDRGCAAKWLGKFMA